MSLTPCASTTDGGRRAAQARMRIEPLLLGSVATLLFLANHSIAADERTVDLEFKATITQVPADAAFVDLWLPIPSDGDGQRVSAVQAGLGDGGSFNVDKTHGNHIYHRRFAGPFVSANEAPSAKVAFRVVRREFVVDAAKKTSAPAQGVVPDELAVYLKPSSMIPIDGRVAEIAAPLKLSNEDPIRSARTAYNFLLERMNYNWMAKGAGRGDALWACDSRTGDCTDYHSLFIALCRANGIPADHEFGLPLAKNKKSGSVKYFHCWARFWAAGVGWIPVDISEADKHPELREYNFGSLSPNYVRMSHGRDIVLEPPQAAEPLNMFHGPYAEIAGELHQSIQWSITFQEVTAGP